MKRMDAGLKKAIEAAGGSRYALANLIGITVQAVAKWDKIPEGKVLRVAQATGLKPEILRPDLFKKPAHA